MLIGPALSNACHGHQIALLGVPWAEALPDDSGLRAVWSAATLRNPEASSGLIPEHRELAGHNTLNPDTQNSKPGLNLEPGTSKLATPPTESYSNLNRVEGYAILFL